MKAKTRYKTQFHPQRALSEINVKTYEYIDSLGVESVFEFGCGVGRHLDRLKERGMYVMGSDINKQAVREAKKKGLTVFLGDEYILSNIPSNSFDIVFTNSVLCHIPDIDKILSELKRISKKHLIFVERQQEDEGHWYVHQYEGDKVFTMTTKTTGYDYSLFHLCV